MWNRNRWNGSMIFLPTGADPHNSSIREVSPTSLSDMALKLKRDELDESWGGRKTACVSLWIFSPRTKQMHELLIVSILLRTLISDITIKNCFFRRGTIANQYWWITSWITLSDSFCTTVCCNLRPSAFMTVGVDNSNVAASLQIAPTNRLTAYSSWASSRPHSTLSPSNYYI